MGTRNDTKENSVIVHCMTEVLVGKKWKKYTHITCCIDSSEEYDCEIIKFDIKSNLIIRFPIPGLSMSVFRNKHIDSIFKSAVVSFLGKHHGIEMNRISFIK